MKKNSNVTVVIPCYNDGQYIMEALQSIYKQTVLPEKIIIVDDGSNTETKTILGAIKHPLLEIIYQENKGVSSARNTAINLAQTDYILNLDADDYFESTFIEKATAILDAYIDVGIVGCWYRPFKNRENNNQIIKPLGGDVRNFLVKNNGLNCSMYRKNSWELALGYDIEMKEGYEDWDFFISVLKLNCSMYIIEEVLFNYRIKLHSRDHTALVNHDFELRKKIFKKHHSLYENHNDFFILELLRQNSLLRNAIFRVKKTKEFKIGATFLSPIYFIKNILNKNG